MRGSLTRGFTATECSRFNLGNECPTLAELRGRPAGSDDPSMLGGVYQELGAGELQFSDPYARPIHALLFATRPPARAD